MLDMGENITGKEAIVWFCAALSDLHCDTGGLYQCFCDDEVNPEAVRVSKVMVDFALMAIRNVSWELRKDNPDLTILPELLEQYMKEHRDPWQEEYA